MMFGVVGMNFDDLPPPSGAPRDFVRSVVNDGVGAVYIKTGEWKCLRFYRVLISSEAHFI
jgi:hypothetical protein